MLKTSPLYALVLLFFAPFALAQEAKQPQLATAPDSVRKPLMAQDWDLALRELDKLIERDDAAEDHWLLLKAIAQRGAGQLDAAEATLTNLEREHVGSAWTAKSRFMRADLYRELHRYEEAVVIYEQATHRLRSGERQAELANIYFEFADALSAELDPSQPGSTGQDFARAAVLYRKVLDLDAPRTLQEKATYRVAQCLLKAGQFGDAASQYEAYLDEFGIDLDADNAALKEADIATSGRILRARLELAECRLNLNQRAKARRELEELAAQLVQYQKGEGGTLELGSLDEWSAKRSLELADLEGETLYAIAQTASNPTGAINDLSRLLELRPNWKRSFEAHFEIGQHYASLSRHEDALAAFDRYTATPPSTASESELREQDQRLRMRSLFLRGQILSQQMRYERAIATFADYVARYSSGPDWSAAQEALIESEYAIGVLHREEKRFDAARSTWSAFLKKYPLNYRASTIMFDIGELFAAEAREREDDESAETRALWRAAIDAWRRVVTKYPGTHEASHALYRIGETYETRLVDFHEAIAAYRACNFASHQHDAQAKLAAMAEETLSVRTERTWRTDEKPKIQLTTRNLEEVTIELYALDLEAYFRKHLTHRRIEDLDLDLISTDQEITAPIENYERYKLTQQDFELPVEGPGVWAVVVIAGEQRATTLVLQSDIDLIVKSSRTEIFAYAQDMRRGVPAPGVQLLVGVPSNQKQASVVEATTNENGVARLSFPELKFANAMHVFAMQDGSFAAHGISIGNLSIPTGLTPRGMIYTERSAYRPGQVISWRSILRDVENGSFSFVEGAEYLVEMIDSQGRVVVEDQAKMSAFGTLDGTIALDEFSAFGTYTLRCSRKDRVSASCNFTVEEYKLQKVELSIAFERETYFRGETVEAEIAANHYYGAPLSDSPLRVILPGNREVLTRTDADGKAKVSFETRDYAREQRLSVNAYLTQEQVRKSEAIHLAVNGFDIKLTSAREVYLGGSPFSVDVATSSPNGEPVSKELTLRVLRLEAGPFGSTTEVKVSSHKLTTDADSGKATQALRVAKGGNYLVRVQGVDRFKNLISAKRRIFISGDEDDVKLRFLTDAKKLNVGEAANIELSNRAAEGLALVTFEGDGVFDYRVVKLVKGSNPLEFLVAHEHVPNFAVTASMMDSNRFHTAVVPFAVERKLNVTVEPESSALTPGGQARVMLRVTDQLGNPVQAELSLAVVDEALFELYASRTPSLASVFDSNTRREANMQTVTSCAFSYQGVTRQISQAILAEQERLEEEAKWKASRKEVTSTRSHERRPRRDGSRVSE